MNYLKAIEIIFYRIITTTITTTIITTTTWTQGRKDLLCLTDFGIIWHEWHDDPHLGSKYLNFLFHFLCEKDICYTCVRQSHFKNGSAKITFITLSNKDSNFPLFTKMHRCFGHVIDG